MFAWLVTGPELWSLCYTARGSLEILIIEAQRRELGSGLTPFTDFLGKTTELGKARDELKTRRHDYTSFIGSSRKCLGETFALKLIRFMNRWPLSLSPTTTVDGGLTKTY
ncbi:hypothetical protein F4801DRAFT_583854 [Xylaria longipes]|nr:hypothetical protein F4801DRAFT_583854 [Xylaria longipes]